MACGVLRTAYIKVYVTPVSVGLLRDECLAVAGIHIAQIVCRRACETGHRIELYLVSFGSLPVFCPAQRRLTALSG